MRNFIAVGAGGGMVDALQIHRERIFTVFLFSLNFSFITRYSRRQIGITREWENSNTIF